MWRVVRGFPKYEVSNKGDIRHIEGKVRLAGAIRKGYRRVCIRDETRKPRNVSIHRAVAEAFVPNPLNKPHVNHIDCNKLNNSADNLEWVTNQENHRHKMENGLNVSPKGEESGASKLTESEVIEIYTLIKDHGLYLREVSSMYGISISTASRISRGELWRDTTAKLRGDGSNESIPRTSY